MPGIGIFRGIGVGFLKVDEQLGPELVTNGGFDISDNIHYSLDNPIFINNR